VSVDGGRTRQMNRVVVPKIRCMTGGKGFWGLKRWLRIFFNRDCVLDADNGFSCKTEKALWQKVF